MKKTILSFVSLMVLGFATAASAQDVTYTFTGTGSAGGYPPNFIDGSTVTIEDGSIVNYNFEAPGFGDFGTPATTSIGLDLVTSSGPTGWTGELDLGYQFIDIEVTGDSFTSQALQASIQGGWAVPDNANTFALLGALAVGLVAARPMLRRQG